MLTTKKHFSIFIVALAAFLLISCGSSTTTSSTGGNSNNTFASANSTLVIDIANSNIAATLLPNITEQPFLSLPDILIESAQANHIAVSINGIVYGETDGSESLMFAVSQGSYTINFTEQSDPDAICSAELTVGEDQIIYWNEVSLDFTDPANCVTNYTEVIDDSLENIINGGGESADGKTLICHKNKKAISVSLNALSAHRAHGDTTGFCLSAVATEEGEGEGEGEGEEGEETKPIQSAKPGNRGNRGNNAKKPKS